MKPAIAVVLLLVGQVGVARAEPDRSALVVVSASDRVAGPVKVAAERAIVAQSWRVASAKPSLVKAMARCTIKDEGQCLKAPLGRVRTGVMLLIRAKESTGNDGEPRVILDGALFDPATVKVLKSTQRHCLRCHGTARLAEMAGELATELIRGRAAQLAPHTKLRVIATPGDAILFMQGARVGMAGRSYQVPPGPLEFRLERKGYESVTRHVQLKPNQELVLRIQLASSTKGGTKKPPARRRYAVWGVGGAGVMSLAAGVRWLVINRGTTSENEQNPTTHSVRTRGFVAIGLGTALLGTAALLWYRGRKSSVSIAPTPSGGVAVLWRGSF